MKRRAEMPLEDLRGQLARERMESAGLREELERMRNSSSWKFTAPLRALATMLRSGFAPKHAPDESRIVAPDRAIPRELLASHLPERGSDMSYRLVDAAPFLSELLPEEVAATYRSERAGSREQWHFGGSNTQSIALVSGPSLARELAFECRVTRLSSADTGRHFVEFTPDFLLIDTDFQDMDAQWSGHLRTPGSPVLAELLAECVRRNIPTAIWLRLDPGCYESVRHLLSGIHRIYAVDVTVLALAGRDVDSLRLRLLPPQIQPCLHNPARSRPLDALRQRLGFTVLRDGMLDMVCGINAPAGTTCDRSWLVESSWDFSCATIERVESSPGVLAGVVDEADKLILSRVLEAEAFTTSNTRPAWRQRRDILRAMASGALIVADAEARRIWPFEDIEPFATSIDDACALAQDGLAKSWWRRRALDRIIANHSWKRALVGMRVDMGLEATPVGQPLISCLLATRRPEQFAAALSNFNRQTYPERELIVVRHGALPDAWPEVSDSSGRVVMLSAPYSLGLGDCLNVAVANARGMYWVKMDDDDYYAPEYLARLVGLMHDADAELSGMPLAFTAFASDRSVFWDPLRAEAAFRLYHGGWSRGEICGATLAGKIELPRRIPFAAGRRHGTDSLFLDDCERAGTRMVVGDGFGYICQRSAAQQDHTWEGDEAVVRARGYELTSESLPPEEMAGRGA